MAWVDRALHGLPVTNFICFSSGPVSPALFQATCSPGLVPVHHRSTTDHFIMHGPEGKAPVAPPGLCNLIGRGALHTLCFT